MRGDAPAHAQLTVGGVREGSSGRTTAHNRPPVEYRQRNRMATADLYSGSPPPMNLYQGPNLMPMWKIKQAVSTPYCANEPRTLFVISSSLSTTLRLRSGLLLLLLP